MNDTDEDIDPPAGPIADLMAEYQLSSSTTEQSAATMNHIIELKGESLPFIFLKYLYSLLNIRALFQHLFGYLLDIRWSYYMNKNFLNEDENEIFPQQNPSDLRSSIKQLTFLLLFYVMLTFSFPFFIHGLFFIYILFLCITDLLIPLYLYHRWFECLVSIRIFFETIQIHQQWLIRINGFQLIRPISSSFDQHLCHLRRTIFQQLQKHFLHTRQIASRFAPIDLDSVHLLCQIDLDEFGPLVSPQAPNLDSLTNHFDQASLRSLGKLCRLQVNECINSIHFHRPKSIVLIRNYNFFLQQSIEEMNQARRQCSFIVDNLTNELARKSNGFSSRLTPACFLLRSNCEQLFEMNRIEQINDEQFQRIIHDLKNVVCSLEAVRNKHSIVSHHRADNGNDDLPPMIDSPPSEISSFHRFDDQLHETVDEILMCETGTKFDDENLGNALQIDDYDKRFLREQTSCLLVELRSAIAGKKQEWQEREQRLLGPDATSEEVPVINPAREESFEKAPLLPSPGAVSMLDELKHTFALNRKKLNVAEDVFGEDDDDDDDDQDIE